MALSFDPSSGKEMMKRRPVMVISKAIFNAHTGFALVAPITNTIRNIALEVLLPDSLETTGAILIHQMKSLDFEERNAMFIEKAPQRVIQKATAIAQAIVA